MTQTPQTSPPVVPDAPRNRASALGATETPSVPPYDAEAVGRVAAGVHIAAIDLVGANFTRADTAILPVPTAQPSATPEMGIDVQYELAKDGQSLGCLLTFATVFEGEEPYRLTAQFRLTYDVNLPVRPADEDVRQFAHWNAVFNAWPYWREYLSSTLNRARLDRFLVPVMGVPRPQTPSPG